MKTKLLGLVLFFSQGLSAQFICSTVDSALPATPETVSCTSAFAYIPGYGAASDAVLEVNLAFVVLQNANGHSPFADNYLQDLLDFSNAVHNGENPILQNMAAAVSNPDPIVYNGTALNVTDAGIRLVVDTIIYIRNSVFPGAVTDLELYAQVPESIRKHSNVVIMATDTLMKNGSTHTIPGGRALGKFVFMANFKPSVWFGGLLLHELGHLWGLPHTFHYNSWGDGDNIPDTPLDIYATDSALCYPLNAPCHCPPATPYPNNVCPANIMGYNQKNYFSPRQIGIIRSTLLGKFSYALAPQQSGTAPPLYTVAQDEVWDSPRSMGDVTVKSGATLTIRTLCLMSNASSIRVEPNAHLILDCAELTSSGEHFWSGIKVLGDNTKRQVDAFQGKLTMENSRISRATDAIGNGDWIMCAPVISGAIISVNHSTFENNIRDVILKKYDYKGSPLSPFSPDYRASFRNCTFVKNEEINNPYQQNRLGALVIWGVEGIVIDSCTFSRDEDLKDQNTSPETCMLLFDASVKCTHSEFIGHYKYAMKLNSTTLYAKGSEVKHCVFNKAKYGIYANGGESHQFIKNRFIIPVALPLAGFMSNLVKLPYGVYMNSSHNFTITENFFLKSGISAFTAPPGAMCIGLLINENGAHADQVFKNRFTALDVAIEALGKNKNSNGLVGLEFRCNNFINNLTDVYVGTNFNWAQRVARGGVRKNQGNPDPRGVSFTLTQDLAGNLFSSGTQHTYDVNNSFSEAVNYYHHAAAAGLRTEPDLNQNVNTFDAGVSYAEANACPTRLAVRPEGDTSLAISYSYTAATADLTQYAALADSIKDLMEQLVDGGNTLALQVQILFTEAHEYYQLYQDLLAQSPYLSLSTLEEVVRREDFPDLMLRNIFMANPQAAKEPYLMDLLTELHPGMPQQMVDDILDGKDNFGALELLQIEYSNHISRGLRAADRKLELYKTDESTTDNLYADAKAVLQAVELPYYQYRRAELEYRMGNPTGAAAILEAVGNSEGLDEDQREEHRDHTAWFNLMSELEGGDLCHCTGGQLDALATMGLSAAHSSALARSVLAFREVEVEYTEPMVIPPALAAKKAIRANATGTQTAYANSLYPNPAHAYFIIEVDPQLYRGPGMRVEVTDPGGRLLLSRDMNEQIAYLSTAQLPNGVYGIEVKSGTHTLLHTKVVVAKR